MRRLNKSGVSKLTTMLVVLVVLAAAAAASLGTYIWQHNKINDLNGVVSGLNSKVVFLNGQISSLNSQIGKSCQTQTQTTQACTKYTFTSAKGVSIQIFEPLKSATVSSPVAVIGEVPGSWSFEAQFPVLLKDGKGNVVARTTAHLLGNWQTSQPVAFSAQLTYNSAPSGSGTLVLQKDNPSGLAQNADSVTVPIKF